MNQAQPLTRKQIRQIFDRHRGAAYKLAEELGKSRNTVSQVLRGKGTSQPILDAARARAAELLASEQQQQKGAA